MSKFEKWFYTNRQNIGYTVGGLNIGAGLGCLWTGSTLDGVISLIIGVSFVFDAYIMEKNNENQG